MEGLLGLLGLGCSCPKVDVVAMLAESRRGLRLGSSGARFVCSGTGPVKAV